MKVIILAGGKGKRLWPYSNSDTPKQFLPLFDGRSLFQITLSRWLHFCTPREISIVSHHTHEKLLYSQLQEFGSQFNDRIIWEPERKNTAAALCFALKSLEEKNELEADENILVVPSDHLFSSLEIIAVALKKAEIIALEDQLILFGITPTRAETGYGYIQIKREEGKDYFPLLKFIEKPAVQEAVQLISQPDHLWNSGMIFFKPRLFWSELFHCCGNLYSFFDNPLNKVQDNFFTLSDLSLDHALLERTDRATVLPLNLEWTDMGSWDAIYEVEKKDSNGNLLKGDIQTVDSYNNLIMGSEKPISVIGVEDILVVDAPEGLLIVKKGQSQKVKFLTRGI